MLTDSVHAYATSARRPCCSLVAVWLLDRRGERPADPTDERAWAALRPEWWRRANVWSLADLWSALGAARELVGGDVLQPAPDALPVGRWVVVQRWTRTRTAGHTYLVQARADGWYDVVQSDAVHGLRCTVDATWRPRSADYGICILQEVP